MFHIHDRLWGSSNEWLSTKKLPLNIQAGHAEGSGLTDGQVQAQVPENVQFRFPSASMWKLDLREQGENGSPQTLSSSLPVLTDTPATVTLFSPFLALLSKSKAFQTVGGPSDILMMSLPHFPSPSLPTGQGPMGGDR